MNGVLPQHLSWRPMTFAAVAAITLQGVVALSVTGTAQVSSAPLQPEPIEIELLAPPVEAAAKPEPVAQVPASVPPSPAAPESRVKPVAAPPVPPPETKAPPEPKAPLQPKTPPEKSAPALASPAPAPVASPETITDSPAEDTRPAASASSSASGVEPSDRPRSAPGPQGKDASVASAPAQGDTVSAARPDYLSNPAAEYPVLARRKGWEGIVVLKVRISASGVPREIRLLRSAGHDILDRSAQQTVEHWRFVPAMRNGQPVEAWVEVPVRFELTS